MMLSEEMTRPYPAGMPPLPREEAQALAGEVPEWTLRDHLLEREFRLADFRQAMDFVNAVAHLAEELDHHPEMLISYDRVRIQLTTHKVHGLTRNDFILAARIDRLV